MTTKILIAGDYCPYNRISAKIENNDFSFFEEIRDIVKSADYSIVNFECPVADEDATPIVKNGINLRTTRAAVEAIKFAGFNCATLANNHFRDFGDTGCSTTINELTSHGIDYVGGGANLHDAQKILYKVINNIKIGLLNVCENEFSIATNNCYGAAPLDPIDNYHQIMEARNNADYVIVIVHGGHEFYQLPSPRMQKLYRHFIDLGADAVINHHQHCYSGYEEYKGKHIIYGLGNLCFDWGCNSGQKWVEGYMITLNIKPDTTTISLHPYIQCQEKASILIMDQESSDNFHEKIENLNEIINNDLKLHEAYSQYVNNHRSRIIRLFSSYHNRYLNAAVKRGLLPQLTNRKELLSIMNYITCEAHRDVTINVLNDFLHHKL